MCGIAGLYERTGTVDMDVVRAMTRTLVHRGPDGEGIHADERVGLGVRRLAIVDLEHGDQPLYSEDRQIAVVFNGEIYNHRSLRTWLEDRGHRLGSWSDGAVLPHLYEELGDRFVERLNGIFSIAVRDMRNDTLLLARDRFGVKPLYWVRSPARVAFASEVKALLAHPAVLRAVDVGAIDHFLTFRFVPAPLSPFAGVSKLRPATVMTVTADGEHERVYWTRDEPDTVADDDELVHRFSDLFERAVVRQMMSDRPIGVMLSGGVDSGAITAAMAKHSSQVRTFTIGFAEGGDADETTLAEETARMFSTKHESLTVSSSEYIARLPDSFATIEEPIGTSSALAVQYVSEMMRERVPVGLSGQGADELMGGYWRYVGIAIAQAARGIRPIAGAATRLPIGRLSARVSRGVATLAAERDLDVLMDAYCLFGDEAKRRLYRPEILEQLAGSRPSLSVERYRGPVANHPLLEQMLHVDMRLWLPDELLLIADKMAMSASVELRVPFLDNELVALGESIPGSLKVKRLRRKHLHKRAMTRWLPREVVYRKERGWATPMGDWLRNELRPTLEDVLFSEGSVCRDLFQDREMRRLVEDHSAGKRDLTRQLFCLLSLGLWHRSFGIADAC